MLRIIIAGGRDFSNYDLLKETVNRFLSDYNDEPCIICGKAKGADTLGEKFAKEHGYKIRYFPADWGTYGKAAGFVRNIEMAENADALIAFWNGKSSGTKHMIETAKKNNLNYIVQRY